MLIKNASWIQMKDAESTVVPVFRKVFNSLKPVRNATLEVTCDGVYEAVLNGGRVGDFILAPGWTQYNKRLQVQCYDITGMLKGSNVLEVTVGNGWFRRTNAPWTGTHNPDEFLPAMLIAAIHIVYADGSEEVIPTDESWQVSESTITLSGIFLGEDVDMTRKPAFEAAVVTEYPKDILIPQEGPQVLEQEKVFPRSSFRTPRNEWVLDFGQNLTGYMYFEMDAHAGERLSLSTAEVLDRDGNFYTGNYRSARSQVHYICREGHQGYKPRLTFFGFRYLRIDEAPEGFSADNIHAIVLHSQMTRTGWLDSSDPMLNQLFSNILWGQKGNYLDIPTDCPQRDERYGWTGDGQIFCRAATYQYDVRQFFVKWLADMRAAQREDGWVPEVIPSLTAYKPGGAAWSDAVAIIPWQLYETYGDVSFISDMYDAMTKWLAYIPTVSTTPDLFTGCWTYGDWLALDWPEGYVHENIELSKRGASKDDLICSAFYANSVNIVIKAGRILGRDVSEYEALYSRIKDAYWKAFGDKLNTQTEKVLTLHFNLADDPQSVGDALAEQVRACGMKLQTGLLGTPYLLHELSRYGHSDIAWSLLLRKEYPGWLYSVSKGATTVWEHWDGIKPDGTFWDDDMNSYNHYAYASVADWVFGVACGIKPASPGFARVRIEPHPDKRLTSLSGVLDTVHGRIRSSWKYTENGIRYEIDTPVETEIVIGGVSRTVKEGKYILGETID
ncbi:MAG: family 78 glycoside hydrolase catalytic domain [Bacteroidales bacterium]|nr:family 78 glycoside hydrolase catalytic domain [Bacteroidales bacterium]